METGIRTTHERMGAAERPPLPFERAFVVQIRGTAHVLAGAVSGRVEHLSSGAAGVFDSVEELIAWMGDAIARSDTRRA
jgi:hypothetical protein